MAVFRSLLSVLSLIALVGALCAPATAAHATAGTPEAVRAAATEPCPATSGQVRCEIKALPVVTSGSSLQLAMREASAWPHGPATRGLWPDVDPDPPRT